MSPPLRYWEATGGFKILNPYKGLLQEKTRYNKKHFLLSNTCHIVYNTKYEEEQSNNHPAVHIDRHRRACCLCFICVPVGAGGDGAKLYFEPSWD